MKQPLDVVQLSEAISAAQIILMDARVKVFLGNPPAHDRLVRAGRYLEKQQAEFLAEERCEECRGELMVSTPDGDQRCEACANANGTASGYPLSTAVRS